MKTLAAFLDSRRSRWKVLLFIRLVIQGMVLFSVMAQAATFNIDTIHEYDNPGALTEGIAIIEPYKKPVFIPQISVRVRTSNDFQSKNIFARAYFFDSLDQKIQAYQQPVQVLHQIADGVRSNTLMYALPTVIPKNKSQTIYFPLPDKLSDGWKVVIVFGTTKGAVATVFPEGDEKDFNYPERALVEKTALDPDQDIVDADPLPTVIEEKVDSNNPQYPTFTLLLHLPHGVTDPQKVSGVMAVCLVASSVGEMRDELNAIQPQGNHNPYYDYAEAHNFAILAWGARWVWASYANFDELNKDQATAWDDDFQKLVNAWDHGVDQLVYKYKIPDHDYIMYGPSAGGEWVHRLALHKPDRFLAVQMHVSTSYDAPTPEGSRVMWLLSTGELDAGCDNARKFYAAARALNYPIIFKAGIGLGHASSPAIQQLGLRFFDYALSLKKKRDEAKSTNLEQSQPLDFSQFYVSPYYGDLMNQEMFAAQDKNMIPPGFLVPLPNKDIADAWNKP